MRGSSKLITLILLLMPALAQAQILSYFFIKSYERGVQNKYIEQKKVEIMQLRQQAQTSVKEISYYKALYQKNGGYSIEYKGFGAKSGFVNVSNRKNIYVAAPSQDELKLGVDYQDWLRVNFKERKLFYMQVDNGGAILATDIFNLPTRNYVEVWREKPWTMTGITAADLGLDYLVYDNFIRSDKPKTRVVSKEVARQNSLTTSIKENAAGGGIVQLNESGDNILIVGDDNKQTNRSPNTP